MWEFPMEDNLATVFDSALVRSNVQDSVHFALADIISKIAARWSEGVEIVQISDFGPSVRPEY